MNNIRTCDDNVLCFAYKKDLDRFDALLKIIEVPPEDRV